MLSCRPVPAIRCTHVEVYVFRRRARRIEFLALRRSRGRRHLPGVWQPVTGKIGLLETALEAAVREVREETGLSPKRWWSLETMTTYFDASVDGVRVLPLFAAEIGARSRVVLSKEHDDQAFLGTREAGRRYLWEAQRRALEAVRREVLGRRDLAKALELEAGARRVRRRK